ncbi:MAG: alanine--tRNA ligase [Nanoarchaeota archaeon]|nr:alanine--tRNA ligase [Nanoarchaeota archaeon]
MLSDKELKKKMKQEFFKNYRKYYPTETLEKLGFKRYVCKKCGRGFWSTTPRDVCNDASCDNGYTFIGKKPIKKFGYKEGYDLHVKFMKRFGYKPIKRYPVVARWYDKLYFVAAGINIFQPYVVSGEVPPPHQATLEDQFCLRFNDIENVGITGSHYTGFIMIGHHVFNTPNKFLYFKNEGVEQFTNFFIKALKVPKEKLVLHEDVWVGGGNFGPSIEFFAYGLELGNQVYMQYEQTESGYRELKTKIIDMGSGAERWAWLSSGMPTSYDAVFPKVLKYLYKKTGTKPNKEIWEKFAQWASILNVDETQDVEKAWEIVSKKTGFSSEELKKEILPISALYSIADHTRTLLVAINDGELPSNVGGGYNLRNILRRCFSFIDKYNWNIDLENIFKLHLKEFGKWYKDLKYPKILPDLLSIERERYNKTLQKAQKIIKKIVKTNKLDVNTMLKLYESNGITPELIKQIAPDIKLPSNFYNALDELKKKSKKKKEEISIDVSGIPKTILGFREDQDKFEFKAKVIAQIDNFVILDKTYFYPRSGGQDYDLGDINGIKLKSVLIKDGVVLHELQKAHKFDLNQIVECRVDKERRMQLTITHSAVHLVGYAARKVLGEHVNQAGSEKTIEKGKLDITHYKPLSFEEFQEIERIANKMIKKAIKVEIMVLPREVAERRYGMQIYQGGAVPGREIRIVKIGKDVQACGGTHVKNTKEIKIIKLLSTERIKDGVVRIEMAVGDKAIERIQKEEKILKELTTLWNVSIEDLPKTAKRFFEEWKNQRNELKKLKEEVSKRIVEEALKRNEKLTVVKLPIDDFGILAKIGQSFKLENKALILIGENFAYGESTTPDIDVKKEIEKLCEKVDGDPKRARGFKLKASD